MKKKWEHRKAPDKYPAQDWLTKAGAYDLGESIRNYWAERGYKVKVELEPLTRAHNDTVYAVRSNLVMGLPPR